MFAWSAKTRRAPSRHCRDARVCGHTTTAMHGMSTPSTPEQPGLLLHVADDVYSFDLRQYIPILFPFCLRPHRG